MNNTQEKVERCANNLFWRLRDTMFAMDRRGESFPCNVAERVIKYSPKTLLADKEAVSNLVYRLMSVVVDGVCIKDCREAVHENLN